jgi:hypothetical protein
MANIHAVPLHGDSMIFAGSIKPPEANYRQTEILAGFENMPKSVYFRMSHIPNLFAKSKVK